MHDGAVFTLQPSREGSGRPCVCCLASATKAPAKHGKADGAVKAAPASNDKPATDVVAGAVARAASQSTIHPIDTMKVRMQAGKTPAAAVPRPPGASSLQHMLLEVGSLYKGVLGAATGAGIIIGSYFAFYSNTKKVLRERTTLPEGSIAFISGATAAVGSSIVKVPIAVCIRSVQAGVYPNAINAATSILNAAGVRGLFTGFLPTLLEDVPDMAVKFAVYESLRAVHVKLCGEQPSTWQDLLMGGTAGAAAAAATTPLDVVKTRMMCSASQRPTIVSSVRSILADGGNWKSFFRGVGPRALSNGLNSAVFFCFFEAIRRMLLVRQQELAVWWAEQQQQQQHAVQQPQPQQKGSSSGGSKPRAPPAACLSSAASWGPCPQPQPAARRARPNLSCLSLAIPLAYVDLA